MKTSQWDIFQNFKAEFKNQCQIWQKYSAELIPLQKQIAFKDTPDYPIETPIVYNTSLEELTKDSQIKLIIIADNPGKSEQLQANQKYLIGQAGKIAENFFKNNPELKIDFRKNTIILNKTPIHSAKTNHLSKIDSLLKINNSQAKNLILESQLWMAKKTAQLHKDLLSFSEQQNFPQLWLVGYGELKNKGIFVPYKNELFKQYDSQNQLKNNPAWNNVFVYQHFSMNRFSIDLKSYMGKNNLNLTSALKNLGTIHKNEIFF